MDGHGLTDSEPKQPGHKIEIRQLTPKNGVILLLIVLTVFLIWYWWFSGQKKVNPSKPFPVVTAIARTADVPVYLTALGNVTPITTVTVQTQINGIITEVAFKEGELVKKGQLLAQIDSRPYEALLVQYEGNLKRDSALLANAKTDLRRYQTLWKQNSVSQQILSTQEALVKQYEGATQADKGLIQSTQVNLNFCRILSPVDGRIGLRLVDPGNYIQISSTTGIAVVNTINPITVIFTLPEDNLTQFIPDVYEQKKFKVDAYDRQQNKLLASGTLLAIDNQINTSTGTFKLRGIFSNDANTLFPNQFVNIRIGVNTLVNATLVPTSAIQHTSKSEFVYLVNEDQTVTANPVISGPITGDETVIVSGLLSGKKVVVDGADKLMDGAQVLEGNQSLDPPKPEPHKVASGLIDSRHFS